MRYYFLVRLLKFELIKSSILSYYFILYFRSILEVIFIIYSVIWIYRKQICKFL